MACVCCDRVCDNCCPGFLSSTVQRQLGLVYDLTFNETCSIGFGSSNTTFVLSRSAVAANLIPSRPCIFSDSATRPPTSGFIVNATGQVIEIPSFEPSLIRSYGMEVSVGNLGVSPDTCQAQATFSVQLETFCARSYAVSVVSPVVNFFRQPGECMSGVLFPFSSTSTIFASGRFITLSVSGTVDISSNPLP
jgi:hypothetical protein